MNILIVEDMPIIAKRIERLLDKHFSISLIKISYSFDDARFLIKEKSFDLMFLDLNLNGKDGFKLLELPEVKSFQTIVITANKEEAMRAFDYVVFDFIGKPINEARFRDSVQRFMESPNVKKKNEFLSVKQSSALKLIPIHHILYIKAAGNYVEIYDESGAFELCDSTLEECHQKISNELIRVHKSFSVIGRKIKLLNTSSGGKHELVLVNDSVIPVGRTFYKPLKQLLE